jgi:hypothetical protein
MLRSAPWLVRAGALISAAAFFLPFRRAAGRAWSPFDLLVELAWGESPESFFLDALRLAGPFAAALLLLAAASLRDGASPFFRGLVAAFVLAGSFALATAASVRLTEIGSSTPSPAFSLVLFAVPVVLAAVLIGRLLGGGDPSLTARLAGASAAVLLLLLNAATLLEAGPSGGPGAEAAPASAAALIVGPALALAGELLGFARPPAPRPAGA